MPEAISSWLRCGFRKLHVRIGEQLEEEGNTALALHCYRECGEVEGLVKAARLQVRLGLHEEAQRDSPYRAGAGIQRSAAGND